MDKQQENLLKQQYINEHIIEKGYNPEDLSNFVSRTRGVKVEDLPLKILEKSIEHFKNEKLNQTYSSFTHTTKKEEKKKVPKKEVPLFDILYAPNTYELICKPQEDNPLNLLEKQKIKIKILISEPKKIQTGGLFGNTILMFPVSCKDINSLVHRTYQDFEWLQMKLADQYPLRYIPPLKKFPKLFDKGDESSVSSRIRYLNKFFDSICRKKILRTSLILYAFLTLPEEKFQKLKAQKENLYSLNQDMSNFVNYSGKMKFELTKDKAIFVNSLQKVMSPTIGYFDKLNTAFETLANDLNNISIHTKEISEIITFLEVEAKKVKLKDNIKKTFAHMSEMFRKTSANFSKQKEIFNNEIKEYFDFMKMEYIQITSLTKDFETWRNLYEDYAIKLKNKKDSLFLHKNTAKWEMDPEDLTDFEALKEDKQLAYEKMCYKENIEAEHMKKNLTMIINLVMKQHEKVCQYQDERIVSFLDYFSKQYENIAEVELNFTKLFSKALS